MRDAGERQMLAFRSEEVEQRGIKPCAEVGSAAVRLQVDAGFDRGVEGRRRPIAAAPGAAEDPRRVLGDEEATTPGGVAVELFAP